MTTVSRLNLTIDVLDTPNQPALALTSLTPAQLIEATLQEFQEIEYLGDSPENYRLLKETTGEALLPEAPLHQQLSDGDHLQLVERSPAHPPAGAVTIKLPVYLRELNSGRVYKLNWLPVIIGRPDHNQPENNLVAVDMSEFETGMRVSRRHAKITGSDDRFYIENLSGNVTKVKDKTGQIRTIDAQRQPLRHGDIIHLERSDLALKFIVRPNPADEESQTL